MVFVGRNKEREVLQRAYASEKPEFIAVYGRRRVGKTYLVRFLYEKEFAFSVTGLANADRMAQLANFRNALNAYGSEDTHMPENWMVAFDMLRRHLERVNRKRKVVFLDELPWMDTAKSGFIMALEHFWNGWASGEPDVMLIVCGSAASWIAKKLFRNRGGLHNRLTNRIYIAPFTLHECEEFFHLNHMNYSRSQLLECYMIFGGIPYYLSLMDSRYSIIQNVSRLCFTREGTLREEFYELYASLFENSQRHMEIVKALGMKKTGMTREEIAGKSHIPNNGHLTGALEELELSGFIRRYQPFSRKVRGVLYQLTDHFTLFHYAWIEESPDDDESYFEKLSPGVRYKSWRGYAFEQVCLSHISQLRAALGISGIITRTASWKSESATPGAQIDLVIDRDDNMVTLCEMKYSESEYVITKAIDSALRNQRGAFAAETGTRKGIQTALITPYGVKPGMYNHIVNHVITMDALFL